MFRIILAAGAIAVSTVTAHGASLLANGDFEAGNTGFASGLTFNPGGNFAAGEYSIRTDPSAFNGAFASFGDHTTGSGNMMVVNGSTQAGDLVWSQTVAVQAGRDYEFGGWIADAFSGSSAVAVEINGTSLGIVTAPQSTGIWDEFAFVWGSSSATSATISVLQQTTGFGGNDYALDDLSFVARAAPPTAAIPLPATLPLLLAALGGAAALRRRTRG